MSEKWGELAFLALMVGGPIKRNRLPEALANRLQSSGLIERWDVEEDDEASTVRLTPAGRAALDESEMAKQEADHA